MSLKVAVVTPTIGSSHLTKCVESVEKQTHKNTLHYIFIDGSAYAGAVKKATKKADPNKLRYTMLQENVGKGWYGHRVYAACSFLVNADVICYLDEDNWLDPTHVEKLVRRLETGADWAYSLRKIYSKEGEFICNDDCESLGKWPVFFDERVHHIDTSSFAVKRDVAVKAGHAWYGQWGADRQFFNVLKQYFPNFECSKDYTLCYRLDGNPKSVTKEFFEQGNAKIKEKYGEELPWIKKEEIVLTL